MDIVALLNAFAHLPEAKPKVASGWLEAHKPGELAMLDGMGFLRRDDRPLEIEFNGDTCAVHYHEEGDGSLLMFFFEEDGNGPVHYIRKGGCAGWEIDYGPLASIARRALGCRGTMEEVVPGFLWRLGAATQQSRDVWLARNAGSNTAVGERLKGIRKSAILLQFGKTRGGFPCIVDLSLVNLLGSVDNSLSLNAEAVTLSVAEAVAAAKGNEGGCENPHPKKQAGYKASLEGWIWTWFDARLHAAKIVEDGEDDDPDFDPAWVEYAMLSQKQICEKANVPEKAFTRALAVWKRDEFGLGRFYVLVTEEFIRRRPVKSRIGDGREAERLNDFFRLHRELIQKMRHSVPHVT